MTLRSKPQTLGRVMEQARKGLRLSMTAVGAELGGLTIRSIGRWERNETLPSESNRRRFVELLARRGSTDTAAVAAALGVTLATGGAGDAAATRESFDAAVRIVADELDVPASRVRGSLRGFLLRMRACGVSVAMGHGWLDEGRDKP